MHFSHHYTVCIGGLIDHATGKHLFHHPQFAWPKDSNLIITTLFNHLSNRLGAYGPGTPQPDTLYLQADNCYAENKNSYVFAFLSVLTVLDIFKDIYFSFLIVGHTHKDIDQLFSTVQTKFQATSIHTPWYVPCSEFLPDTPTQQTPWLSLTKTNTHKHTHPLPYHYQAT
jgi:hypothetical protein